MNARAALGARIRVALSGRPQTWLAGELGASQAAVSEWVRGVSAPDLEHLARLPGLLGVSGHWLLTGEGGTGLPGQPPQGLAAAAAVDLARQQVLAVVRAALDELDRGRPELRPADPSVGRVAKAVAAALAVDQKPTRAKGGRKKRAG